MYDTKSVTTFVAESLAFGLAGLILGSIVDRFCIALHNKYPKKKILISIMQIIISAIIIAIAFLALPAQYTAHFQRTLPGLAFPAFFYGVQSNIYSTWQGIENPSLPSHAAPLPPISESGDLKA